MLVSVAWLRELLPLTRSPEEIARILTARGLTVDETTAVGDDTVLDVDVPANRPDTLGHLGLARELAAAIGVPIAASPPCPASSGAPVDEDVRVRIEAPDLCARYTARLVRGVRVGPSPEWVCRRLEACGLRPINNVVDASNLVLLQTGHPIHTFDLARVQGATIVVRRARAGERLTTLDGIERNLDPDMLVIADERRAVAVAGVMGGADSEISDTTRDVLIEAAWFAPRSIRSTSRRLGLTTDAGQRFERGADPEGVLAAQDAATRLIVALAGGAPAPGTIDVYPEPRAPVHLSVRLDRAALLLGYVPGVDEATGALHALGLAPEPSGDGSIRVTVPTWRVDLEREADLVEEIGRHLGYDRIPTRVPVLAAASATPVDRGETARDVLAHLGFHEAFNYAMIGAGDDDPFVEPTTTHPIALRNPLAESIGLLRRSLLPGLLRAVAVNLRRGAEDVRLYEVGRVFLARGEGLFPFEPLRAAFALAGAGRPPHWSETPREVDLYDAMGVVEALLGVFRPRARWTVDRDPRPGFHPGRSVAWQGADGGLVAWCGQAHPELGARIDAPGAVFLGEIDIDRVEQRPAEPPRYAPLARVPRVTRDLSVVVPDEIPARRVLEVASGIEPPAPVSIEVVDRYKGPPLADAEASLTLRVILQPVERTLTDAETERYREALQSALESEPGLRVRGAGPQSN